MKHFFNNNYLIYYRDQIYNTVIITLENDIRFIKINQFKVRLLVKKFFLSPNKDFLRYSGVVLLKTGVFSEFQIKLFANNMIILFNRIQSYKKIPVKFTLGEINNFNLTHSIMLKTLYINLKYTMCIKILTNL